VLLESCSTSPPKTHPTSAARNGTGRYEVVFSHDISSCVAVAAPGAFHGGGFVNDAVGSSVVPGSGNTVSVFINENGGHAVDTDFMLMLAC